MANEPQTTRAHLLSLADDAQVAMKLCEQAVQFPEYQQMREELRWLAEQLGSGAYEKVR